MSTLSRMPTLAPFVEQHRYSFPIAVDSGRTEETFTIEAWPTYFLVDKTGKLVSGFNHEPPTDDLVDELLKRSADGK